ncbi:ATP-binding protein [Candidatus Woesearchaeota archaeon]|nr:ATP-binding protein [Candidatus Woesearchaeota archaeon]
MKKITILSGKGGVGKSSITASLGVILSKNYKITCVDCDVDASNLALVLGLKEKDFEKWEKLATNQKAEFDLSKCISCKKCFENCYFNAIEWKEDKPVLKEFGCEGCGVCELVCPSRAIKLTSVDNAKIGYGKTKYGFNVVSGQLGIGESGSGKVVFEVRKLAAEIGKDSEFILNDAAAGIGCPVIASVVANDYVIAVTEPTPSGFSDLKRALQMVTHFNINSGIIINKFDLNPDYTKKIEDFSKKNNLKILAKIPYDKSFLYALVNMVPIVVYNPKLEILFRNIAEEIKKEIF